MRLTRTLLLNWLPVLLWMALIYALSADTASFQHTDGLVEPLLRRLFPWLSDSMLHALIIFIRKCGHATEYAILSLLLYRALRASNFEFRTALPLAFALSVLYAITDELHQSFVPNRQGAASDVLIDALGAALALVAFHLRSRRRLPPCPP